MKQSEIEAIASGVANALKKFRAELVKEFEQRMVWKGTYRKGEQYLRGQFVTHDGSLWHCEKDGPSCVPGSASLDWKLAVKRGKDGKDANTGDSAK